MQTDDTPVRNAGTENIITINDIKKNKEIVNYINKGNEYLGVLGFTEHGLNHAERVASKAGEILTFLGYDERRAELAKIAGYLHDVGNCVNRMDHEQTGAIISFRLLEKMGMEPNEIAEIINAIGNHDERTGLPTGPVSAALILADKSDVRRSRVRYKHRNVESLSEDIHDRVNYAVKKSFLEVAGEDEKRILRLNIEIETEISALMEYFEIFLSRMVMCRNAAEFLKMDFELIVNGTRLN